MTGDQSPAPAHRRTRPISALPWMGGKSMSPGRLIGRWILDHMRPGGSHYVEPCAGMANILLARAPAPWELINDLDGRVVNFMRTVRDEPERMSHFLSYISPRHRASYEWAHSAVDDPSMEPAGRAAAFVVLMRGSLRPTPDSGGERGAPSGWNCSPTCDPAVSRKGTHNARLMGLPECRALAERLRGVHVECRDAVEILHRVANVEDATIYVDPPYGGSDHGYAHDVDRAALEEAMRACRGWVYLSGLAGEWDHLGWPCVTMEAHTHASAQRGRAQRRRTEALWCSRGFGDGGQ